MQVPDAMLVDMAKKVDFLPCQLEFARSSLLGLGEYLRIMYGFAYISQVGRKPRCQGPRAPSLPKWLKKTKKEVEAKLSGIREGLYMLGCVGPFGFDKPLDEPGESEFVVAPIAQSDDGSRNVASSWAGKMAVGQAKYGCE